MKAITLLVMALVALSLTACGGGGPTTVESKTYTIGETYSTITTIKGPFGTQTCTSTISGSNYSSECK